MKQLKVYHYGQDDGPIGVEASYMLRDRTLYIKIGGSNHVTDYIRHIFGAWPRRRYMGRKYHRTWFKWAMELYMAIQGGPFDVVEIIGFSMGGPVGVILASLLHPRHYRAVTTINAPKAGDAAAMGYLKSTGVELLTLYDGGDVVHRLPLLYAGYPGRSLRKYWHTLGIGKAHNNKPDEWKEFPI